MDEKIDEVKATDAVNIQFTSGTTGRPKGKKKKMIRIIVNHNNMNDNNHKNNNIIFPKLII